MTSISETSSIPKTKKPSDSAFKQQRLPAWQPILTAGTVLPTFFLIGLAFIPLGIGLLHYTSKVKEFPYDYTNCTNKNNTPCSEVIANKSNGQEICQCDIPINLTEFNGNVFIYYGLTNFYQNHRRYVKSRDDYQLLGKLSNIVSSDCEPFAYDVNNNNKPIAPCGAIANSLFSDKISLYYIDDKNNKENIEVPLVKTGIAWPSDKNIKFKNPQGSLSLKEAFKDFSKPTNWTKNIWELDIDDESNNGFQNEDLIVWMRTAALPTFRKLYRLVNHTEGTPFAQGLRKGSYRLLIDYTYRVTEFEGTKRVIISTTSLLGGKNNFLGIAYIVVGCVCIILGIVLLIIHIKCSKSVNEMINVNQNTPYQ